MIAKYESGTNDPSAKHLSVMADLFGVSSDYLLGRSDDPSGHGIILPELTEEERALVATYRQSGWLGITHLGADRLAGKGDE